MWFFKKTRNKLDEIEQKLNKSFLNIRNDMAFLLDKVDEQNKEIQKLKEDFSTINLLNSTQETRQIQGVKAQQEGEDFTLKNTYETLTNIHKALLFKLSLLLKESPGQWVPMKILSADLYPNKEYEKVKSMISNYTDNLLNLGFIQKRRIGRQIVLGITDKGIECLPQAIQQKKQIRKQVYKDS